MNEAEFRLYHGWLLQNPRKKLTTRRLRSSWKLAWIKVVYLHCGHILWRNLCGNVIPNVSLTSYLKITMFGRGRSFSYQHLYIFISLSSYLHIFISSYLHIFISSYLHLHIFIFISSSSYLYIFISSSSCTRKKLTTDASDHHRNWHG